MSTLNTRQWKLYEFLKEQGDQWTVQVKVAQALSEYYPVTEAEALDFHNCQARHMITNDIRAINDCPTIQKIIISGAKGIKIANSDEFDRYIGLEINSAVRKLMRAKKKAEKGNRDGQMRIVFNSEREVVKAFIDSDKATGQLYRQARQSKGLTAKVVVEILQACGFKVDEPLLSKYENGVAYPTLAQTYKLAEIYGVTPDYLLHGEIDTEADKTANSGLASGQNAV